jgi:hypothetical protein
VRRMTRFLVRAADRETAARELRAALHNIGYTAATTASTGVLTVNTVDKQVFCFLASLKGLSHEMDFKNVDKFTELGLTKTREFFRGNDFIMQKVYLLLLMPICVGLINGSCLFFCQSPQLQVEYNSERKAACRLPSATPPPPPHPRGSSLSTLSTSKSFA